MKLNHVILILVLLLLLPGCVPQEVKDDLNKEDKTEIVTGMFTDGGEIVILDRNFRITPPENWGIKVLLGSRSEFLIKVEDRKNIFSIIMHSALGQVLFFDSRIDVRDGLKPGIEKFLKTNINPVAPELLSVNVQGMALEGYRFGFMDNSNNIQSQCLLFIFRTDTHIIEFKYKASEEDFNETYESVLDAISTFIMKTD
ncbi:MAG TPA: hypothetical protein ENN73_04120 [Firmicutes bacterium]|nr:hypothetical protein [Bacillota bacterium]